MKTRTKTLVAALMLLAISCKKESSNIQSSGIADESATQILSSDASDLVGANAVKIGTQVWMRENLEVTHYRNGDLIPQVKDSVKWSKLTTGAWCWYNNNSANGAVYGKLYNWYAVNDPRGLAPAGWHIPSEGEQTTLSTFLGGDVEAGGKMKSTGTIQAGTGLWRTPNKGATNRSGFTGLPGGIRNFGFVGVHLYGFWWNSTEYNGTDAEFRLLQYSDGFSWWGNVQKTAGLSVRCVKD